MWIVYAHILGHALFACQRKTKHSSADRWGTMQDMIGRDDDSLKHSRSGFYSGTHARSLSAARAGFVSLE